MRQVFQTNYNLMCVCIDAKKKFIWRVYVDLITYQTINRTHSVMFLNGNLNVCRQHRLIGKHT